MHGSLCRPLVALLLIQSFAAFGVDRASAQPRIAAEGAMWTGSAFPVTGDARLRYPLLPWDILPNSAFHYAGKHDTLVHFAVRDSSHFFVQARVVAPAIDAGTLTITANGSRLTSFDSRTGLGSRAILSPTQEGVLGQVLLPFLLAGLPYASLPPAPAAGETLRGYFSSLGRHYARIAQRRPDCPWTRAKAVARARLLDRSVDVIELHPLIRERLVTRCSFAHPGHCRVRVADFGHARLWVDHERPFILRYSESGEGDGRVWPSKVDYQVTSLMYGVGPSDDQLNYQPPGTVVVGVDPTVVGAEDDAGVLGAVSVPVGFAAPTKPPKISSRPLVPEGSESVLVGPRHLVRTVRILYSAGEHAANYNVLHRKYGWRVRRRYVYIEQRRQVAGLPPGLATGVARVQRPCAGRSGSYSGHENWFAFAVGTISTELVSDALTARDLARYAAGSTLCQAPHLSFPRMFLHGSSEENVSRLPFRKCGAAGCLGRAGSFTKSSRIGAPPAACNYDASGRITHERGSKTFRYDTLNTGRTIPHLLLVFDREPAWAPKKITAVVSDGRRVLAVRPKKLRLANAYGWDLGSLPSGSLSSVDLTLNPVGACCSLPHLHAYAEVDEHGNPNPAACLTGCTFAGMQGLGGVAGDSKRRPFH